MIREGGGDSCPRNIYIRARGQRRPALEGHTPCSAPRGWDMPSPDPTRAAFSLTWHFWLLVLGPRCSIAHPIQARACLKQNPSSITCKNEMESAGARKRNLFICSLCFELVFKLSFCRQRHLSSSSAPDHGS